MIEWTLDYIPNSKKEAKTKGYKFYFSGKPCKHGHVTLRRRGGACLDCEAAKVKANKLNPERRLVTQKKYRDSHKEELSTAWKIYHEENKDEINRRSRERYAIDSTKQKESAKRSKAKNKDKVREYDREYYQRPKAKLAITLRARLRGAIKNKAKVGSAVSDLGCTIDFLYGYLEEQFTDNMSWENHDPVWHIDHIKPLSSFDLEDREQFLIASHYTNLQPLSVVDNLSKGARLDWNK